MEELEPILSEIRTRKRVALGFGIMAVGFGVAAPFLPAKDSGGWAMYAIMSFMILFGGYWLIYGLIPTHWAGGISTMQSIRSGLFGSTLVSKMDGCTSILRMENIINLLLQVEGTRGSGITFVLSRPKHNKVTTLNT